MGTGGPSALITPTYRSVFSTVLSISHQLHFVKYKSALVLAPLDMWSFETTYFSKLFPRKSAEVQSFDLSTLPRMHLQGFEPGTHWLRVSCSTNWAKGAFPLKGLQLNFIFPEVHWKPNKIQPLHTTIILRTCSSSPRSISIGQLNTLLYLHLRPINS